MKKLSQRHQGYVYGILSTMIFAFYPVANLWGFGKESMFLILGGGGGFASIFFAIQITIQHKWKEVLSFRDWKNFLGMFVFINVLFYGFYLYGNLITSAGSTSIMSLTQIFSTFLILGLLKYEKFTFQTVFGAFLMIIGAIFVLWKKDFGFDLGALIVCFSFFFTPIGNLFQKRLRANVSSATFLFYRNICVFLFFGILFFIFDKPEFETQYSLNYWLIFLALYGFFFWFLEKQLWTETMHRMPLTKASLLMVLAPPMTLVFAYFVLNEVPNFMQLMGFTPIAMGAYLVLQKDGFTVLKK